MLSINSAISKIEAKTHRQLTSMQKDTLKLILNNNDVYIIAPTGSGKTLAWQQQLYIDDHCHILVIVPLKIILLQVIIHECKRTKTELCEVSI